MHPAPVIMIDALTPIIIRNLSKPRLNPLSG